MYTVTQAQYPWFILSPGELEQCHHITSLSEGTIMLHLSGAYTCIVNHVNDYVHL